MIRSTPSRITKSLTRRHQRGHAPTHQTSLPSIRVALTTIVAAITFLAATLAPLPVVAFQSLRILVAYPFEYLVVVTLFIYALSYYVVSFVAQFTKASRPANPLLQRIERWMGAHHWGVVSGILAALIIGYAVRDIGAPWWIAFAGAGGLRLGVLVDRRQALTKRLAEAVQKAILTLAGPIGKAKGAIVKTAKRSRQWDTIASVSTIGAGAVLTLAAALRYTTHVAHSHMVSPHTARTLHGVRITRGIVGHGRVLLGIHMPDIGTLAHGTVGAAIAILIVGCCMDLVARRGWLGKHIMSIALGLFAAFPISLAAQNASESWLNTFISVLLCAITVAIGVEYKREWFERHARGIFSAVVAASFTYASFRYIGVSPRIDLAVSVATGCGAGLIAEGGAHFPLRGASWWGFIVTYLTAPFTVYALGYAVPPGDLSPSIALTYKSQEAGHMVCGPLLGASDKYWYVLERGRVVPVPTEATVPIAITGAISTSTTSGTSSLAACPTGSATVRTATTPVSRLAVRRVREATTAKSSFSDAYGVRLAHTSGDFPAR